MGKLAGAGLNEIRQDAVKLPKLAIISGCSGDGKSALPKALRGYGESVVEAPGRRPYRIDELATAGHALPWGDGIAFARRAVDMAVSDISAVSHDHRRVFFGRGLVDAAIALEHLTGVPRR